MCRIEYAKNKNNNNKKKQNWVFEKTIMQTHKKEWFLNNTHLCERYI